MNRTLATLITLLIAAVVGTTAFAPIVWTTAEMTSSSSCSSSSQLGATTTTETIGSGRIGSLLAQAGDCVVLGRQDTIDPNNIGNPILIATRNDALQTIVNACPEQRREDLVFLQNGYLDDFLQQNNLLSNTQALLYLSVPAKGEPPMDGITQANPEGLTAVTGKHGPALAQRLQSLQLKCNVLTPEQYRPAMFEKLIWICTYMLVGTAKGCATVGQAGKDHAALVQQVITELVAAVQQSDSTVQFQPGTYERLQSYTDVVANFPCGVKEFEWRNQFFYQLLQPDGQAACPIHNSLLQDCAQQGKLGFELP